MAKRCIQVYADRGTDSNGTKALLLALTKLCPAYKVKKIDAEEILLGKWQETTSLVAFGAGYDKGMIEALGQSGSDLIKNYVQNGGSYLGFCAGGYYGCSEIEFDKNGPNEVIGLPSELRLGFYQGVGIGPTLHPYVYGSEAGADACKVILTNEDSSKEKALYSYYNGGGFFSAYSETKKDCKILGYYSPKEVHPRFETKREFPAIVQCSFGKGNVILSGPHLEYDIESIQIDNSFIKERNVVSKVKSTRSQKEDFLKFLLKELGLNISFPKL